MNKTIVTHINPALKLLIQGGKRIVIANTLHGPELGYFRDARINEKYLFALEKKDTSNVSSFPSDTETLIRRLYSKSLDFIRYHLKDAYLYFQIILYTKLNEIERNIEFAVKRKSTEWKTSMTIILNATWENQVDLMNYLKRYKEQYSNYSQEFEGGISLRINIISDPLWGNSVMDFLGELDQYGFVESTINLTSNHLIDSDHFLLKWLEIIQEDGYSLPFIIPPCYSMINGIGEKIIHYLYRSGLAKYIEMDHSIILQDNNAHFLNEYLINFKYFLSHWLMESDIPLTFINDLGKISNILSQPSVKKITFMGKNLDFEEWDFIFLEETYSLLNRFSSSVDFPVAMYSNALPFHYYQDIKNNIQTISANLMEQYCKIYEECFSYIISSFFNECEENIEENKPLALDLTTSSPSYHKQGWDKARDISFSKNN